MERFDLSYKASIFHISKRAQKDVSGFQKSSYTQDTRAVQLQHSKTTELLQKQRSCALRTASWEANQWVTYIFDLLGLIFCFSLTIQMFVGIKNKVAQERCC